MSLFHWFAVMNLSLFVLAIMSLVDFSTSFPFDIPISCFCWPFFFFTHVDFHVCHVKSILN